VALTTNGTSLVFGAVDSDNVDFLQAGTGAVATDVQSKLRETVSVKDFGAVGDGFTDDTAAIQAASDYFASNSISGTLLFGAGTYLISSTITTSLGVTYEGSGMWDATGTVIKLANNSDCDMFATPTVGFTQFTGFKNMNLDGNKTNQTVECNALNLYWWDIANVLENLSIHDFTGRGLYFNNAGTQTGAVVARKVIANRCDLGGIVVSSPVNHMSFIDCTCEGNGLDGTGGSSGANYVLENMNDTSSVNFFSSRAEGRDLVAGGGVVNIDCINNNGATVNIFGGYYQVGSVLDSQIRITASSTRINTYGLVWDTTSTKLIDDVASGLLLSYSDVESNTSDLKWGTSLFHRSSGNKLFKTYFDANGNTTTHTGGSASPEGLITANAGSTYTRSSTGSTGDTYQKVEGSGNTGWLPMVGVNRVAFADLDATPSVAGEITFRASYSSPTNITNFDDPLTNQKITISFVNNNVTLVHGSNIFMKTGSNVTPTAFTAYSFTYDGARWIEI